MNILICGNGLIIKLTPEKARWGHTSIKRKWIQ